jgi:hypothetical protein
MVTAIGERSNLAKEVRELISALDKKAKDASSGGVTDDDKKELQDKLKALSDKSTEVYSMLRAGPQAAPQGAPTAAAPAPGAGQFDGCY